MKHDALNSYFVWVDKEKQEVKIAPIQKGITNLYKLTSESAQEIKMLILFNVKTANPLSFPPDFSG